MEDNLIFLYLHIMLSFFNNIFTPNGFIITWTLHQIIMYSIIVKFIAG